MLKFFRRIRRKLIDEGSLNKYLFYAFGEILLVVVGVLIAIQLNNANERRKSENNGTLVLKKLKQELEEDIIYFDSLSSEYDDWFIETQHMLDTVLTGQLEELNHNRQYNVASGTAYFLHINKNSYNELMNSGNKIEIKNSELKNDITRYFQFVDIELNKLNLDNERFNQWLYETIDVATLTRLMEKRHLEHEDWSWLKDPTSHKFRNTEARVIFFRAVIKANLKSIKILRNKSQILIETIDSELKN